MAIDPTASPAARAEKARVVSLRSDARTDPASGPGVQEKMDELAEDVVQACEEAQAEVRKAGAPTQ